MRLIDDLGLGGELCDDSRSVRSGDIFVAIKGLRADGHGFISSAVASGARAVVYEAGAFSPADLDCSGSVEFYEVSDSRLALAALCRDRYGPLPGHLLGVTGTSGKSSVVDFVRQILGYMGVRAASFGTLGVRCEGIDMALDGTNLTSPPPIILHKALRDLAAGGVSYAALEASSHGLLQKRLHGLRFSVAGFTGLSRDHLDYHGSMADYFAAKSILFRDLLTPDGIVLGNCDSDYYESLRAIVLGCGHKIWGFGKSGSDIRLLDVSESGEGLSMRVDFFGKVHSCEVRLIGDFQAYNLLLAAGLVYGLGFAVDAIMSALVRVVGVPGRMQIVPCDRGLVVVDYAHKPEALCFALRSLRRYVGVGGRLIVVFGCGGDRDSGKRSQMGAIAGELANLSIITDDNPRGEDSGMIRRAIMDGFAGDGDYIEVADRGEAIGAGLDALGERRDSVLLIAGKGHESGQIVGDGVLPFADASVVRALLGAV